MNKPAISFAMQGKGKSIRSYITRVNQMEHLLIKTHFGINSYVSPRHRAQRTVELLNLGCHDPYPWQKTADATDPKSTEEPSPHHTTAPVTITTRIAEWDYGDYEGITSAEIRTRRAAQGLGSWDIWRDGCPGGESPEDIIARVDDLIAEIRDKYHRPVIGKPKQRERTTRQPSPATSWSSATAIS